MFTWYATSLVSMSFISCKNWFCSCSSFQCQTLNIPLMAKHISVTTITQQKVRISAWCFQRKESSCMNTISSGQSVLQWLTWQASLNLTGFVELAVFNQIPMASRKDTLCWLSLDVGENCVSLKLIQRPCLTVCL